MTYVLDTNILTPILKEDERNERIKQKVQKLTLEGKVILINGISYYEIKRGLLAVNAKVYPWTAGVLPATLRIRTRDQNRDRIRG